MLVGLNRNNLDSGLRRNDARQGVFTELGKDAVGVGFQPTRLPNQPHSNRPD